MSFLVGVIMIILGGMGLTGGYDHAITFHINNAEVFLTPGWTMIIGALLALS